LTKKIIWLLVSCLMVLSLVVASCGTTTVEEEEEEEEVIIGEEEEEEEEEMILPPEVPKYGGVFTRIRTSDPMGWDYAHTREMFSQMLMGKAASDRSGISGWFQVPGRGFCC